MTSRLTRPTLFCHPPRPCKLPISLPLATCQTRSKASAAEFSKATYRRCLTVTLVRACPALPICPHHAGDKQHPISCRSTLPGPQVAPGRLTSKWSALSEAHWDDQPDNSAASSAELLTTLLYQPPVRPSGRIDRLALCPVKWRTKNDHSSCR